MSLLDVVDLLACPVCAGRGQPDTRLTFDDRALRCAHRHTFDVARQGYVNLTAQAEPRHADTAAMVDARERFLDSGAYSPVADAVADAVRQHATTPAGAFLEAGVGPGWYLARLVGDLGPPARGLGLDVSVAACRRAGQRSRVPSFGVAVADVWGRLPVRTETVEVVLSLFAPRNAVEFARVLAPGGLVVVVSPLPQHLASLRDLLGLLDVEPGKQERLGAALGEHLEPVTTTDVAFDVALDHDHLADLVGMGPNAFHAPARELGARIDAAVGLDRAHVAVQVGVWRRPR